MKIGILTYHHVINDGAVLQTMGHLKTLKELFPNDQIEVIDYRYKTVEYRELVDIFKVILKLKKGTITKLKKFLRFKKFVNENLSLSSNRLISDNIDEAVDFINKNNYDFVIVGSDEVWKILDKKFSRKFPNVYWLPNSINAVKIASAVSANTSKESLLLDSSNRLAMEKVLKGFKVIAARDQFTFDLVSSFNIENQNIYQVPDPTFGTTIETDVKEKLIANGLDFSRKRLALSISPYTPEFTAVSKKIREYADLNDIQLVGIGQYNKFCHVDLSSKLNPIEWASSYKYIDFCITDRFHSTIFSMKGLTPFLVVELKEKYSGKFKGKVVDLLTKSDLMSYHTFYDDKIDLIAKIEEIEKNHDTKRLEQIVQNNKEKFRTHLINSIQN